MKAWFVLAATLIAGNMALANSSWVTCTAYSTDGTLGKIEIHGTPMDSKLTVNEMEVKLLPSSEECQAELQCNIYKKYPVRFVLNGKVATLNVNPGASHLQDSWLRGDSEVYEISPTASYNGVSFKLFGACSRYN